jgi:retinol dehydrogenase-12
VNPGYCVSALRGENLPLAERGQRAVLARSTDTGAQTLVDAVRPLEMMEATKRHGAYVDDMKVKKPTAWLETKEGRATQERVWRELNGIFEGIKGERTYDLIESEERNNVSSSGDKTYGKSRGCVK